MQTVWLPALQQFRPQLILVSAGFDAHRADPIGGMKMSRALFEVGLWAMFAGFDRRYLQFKPGLLVDAAYCDEALIKLESALKSVAS